MTSQKQIEANRKNAEKSTGAKTEAGKNIVKLNAIKHGLLSSEVLLEGENRQELDELAQKIRTELAPANQVEMILVERIIANTWRLKRAIKIETEMIQDGWKNNYLEKKTIGQIFNYDFSNDDAFGKFIRYETSIENGIYRALHKLHALKGEHKN